MQFVVEPEKWVKYTLQSELTSSVFRCPNVFYAVTTFSLFTTFLFPCLFFLELLLTVFFIFFLAILISMEKVFQRFLFDASFFACIVFLVAIIVVVEKDVIVYCLLLSVISTFSSFCINSFPFVGHLCCNTILHLVWIVDPIKSLTLIFISYLLFPRENLSMWPSNFQGFWCTMCYFIWFIELFSDTITRNDSVL